MAAMTTPPDAIGRSIEALSDTDGAPAAWVLEQLRAAVQHFTREQRMQGALPEQVIVSLRDHVGTVLNSHEIQDRGMQDVINQAITWSIAEYFAVDERGLDPLGQSDGQS
jgi:hypothetical protein